MLAEDVDELLGTEPTDAVRLLPAYDQWVLGPGTADATIVPPAQRALVSRGANLVVAGGVVAGTWSVRDDHLTVTFFGDAGRPSSDALDEGIAGSVRACPGRWTPPPSRRSVAVDGATTSQDLDCVFAAPVCTVG